MLDALCLTCASGTSKDAGRNVGEHRDSEREVGHSQSLLYSRSGGGGEWPCLRYARDAEKALAKTGTCTLKDFKIEGDIKTETLICGSTTYTSKSTFHGGDSFETTSNMTEGGVAHVSEIKGHRTGACP